LIVLQVVLGRVLAPYEGLLSYRHSARTKNMQHNPDKITGFHGQIEALIITMPAIGGRCFRSRVGGSASQRCQWRRFSGFPG
jgi:hypothetical protein